MNTIKNNMDTFSIFVSLIAVLLFAANFTAEDLFNQWDENNDDKLSKSEFRDNFSAKFYSAWDIRSNEEIDADDFHMIVFNIADADSDEYLNRSEIEWGHEYMYGDYVEFNYLVKETDENGDLEYNRFHDILRVTNFYSDIDLDNNETISKSELTEAVFSSWDLNGNNYLSEEEFKSFDKYYFQIDEVSG